MQQQSSGGDGYMGMDMGGNGLTLTFSGLSPWTLPPVHTFNPVYYHEPFVLSSAHPPLFNRRPFGYDAGPFSLHAELQKFTAQEIMDAKALAASKSHSEAERKRRERINNHLAKLRSLLPSTIKTDKASLLAEVIQHVKELKRQTSAIEDTGSVPTEVDEITVDNAWDAFEDGKCVIKASICCEDRSDLLPELIKTLKSLKLRTLRAEITTLGGRLRNVLFITGDDDDMEQEKYSLSSIQEAFKSVMKKFNGDGNVKRQKFNANILDHYRSI